MLGDLLPHYFSYPWRDFLKVWERLREKQREQKHWQMWLARYPYMDKDTFVSFEDFYKPQNKVSVKPKEDILADVARIREQFGGELS